LHYAFAVKLLIALALLACAPVFTRTIQAQTCASPTPIQITGPVNALSGPMTGTINLIISYTLPGNPPVVQSQLQVQVTAGIMYVNGSPLVCMPAGAAVVAGYSVPNPAPLTGTTKFTRFWAVPASGGPYTLYSGVETVIPATPNLFVSWGQLPQPPSTGTYCVGSVTGAIGWNSCSGGGGAVLSVFGRTAAVTAQSGDYTSDQVTQGTTNLYFANSLARAAFSAPSPLSYNNVTGVFTIQQANTSQAGFLSASDWNTFSGKQAAITTGSTAQYLRGDLSLATLPTFAANTPAVSHQFLTAYNSTSGVFSAAQPAFTDISGSLAHGQLPTLLSADITGALGYTPLSPANNLSDLSSATTARTNLGLGTAATQASSAFDASGAATAAQAAAIAASLQRASNLSDLASVTAAKTNLGLATVATSGSYTDLSSKPTIPTVSGGTCTNQAVTAISASAVPTCTTVTSAYVDTSIAKTGSDINTSNQVTKTAGVAFAPSATTDTTNASNIGSGTLAAARVASNIRVRAIGYTFDGGGSALTAGVTKYLTVPFACTLSAWNISADTGTATIKTWKVATGTTVPTVTNTLSTSGVSLASGTAIHSTTMSDFSSTTVSANDIFGFNLYAVSTATFINFILECDQ
jgi:hypothetical protein